VLLDETEVLEASIYFCEVYVSDGGNELMLLQADISEDDTWGTVDPASWTDWLRGVWRVRGLQPCSPLNYGVDICIRGEDGSVGTARISPKANTVFKGLSIPDAVGNNTSGDTLDEPGAFAVFTAFVNLPRWPPKTTTSTLIGDLQALRTGTANESLTAQWRACTAARTPMF
jgi:hypothetical protein